MRLRRHRANELQLHAICRHRGRTSPGHGNWYATRVTMPAKRSNRLSGGDPIRMVARQDIPEGTPAVVTLVEAIPAVAIQEADIRAQGTLCQAPVAATIHTEQTRKMLIARA